MKHSGTFLIGIILLVAAAGDGVHAQSPSDASDDLSAQGGGPDNRRHEEVLRNWFDRVKIDGRDEARFVEIVFDYRLGLTRRLTYDAQDQLITDEVLAAQPRASTVEIDEAFDTVLRDPEFGQLVQSINALLDGGFLLREADGEPCGPPARCVQVYILSESGHEEHRRPIVELRPHGRIVYRDYQPSSAN